MLGLAAAVFGIPFAVGAGVPVAGALAKGGLKVIGRVGSTILKGRTRKAGLAAAGLGYGAMQFTGSETLSDTYTSIYGPGRNTENVLSNIKFVGNLAGGTAIVLGGITGVLGRMPGFPGGGSTASKAMKMSVKTAGSAITRIKRPLRTISSHPFIFSMAAGAGLGATAAAITSSTRFRNVEGNITAMRSSAAGGMSPELQFSTNNLVFALHKNRKRVF